MSKEDLLLITDPTSPLSNEQKRVIHIHIAEQMAEVEMCLAYIQQRIEWLINHHDLSKRWVSSYPPTQSEVAS